jgi:hypothetical protein
MRMSILAVESIVFLTKLMSEVIHSKRHCKNYGIPFIAEISKPTQHVDQILDCLVLGWPHFSTYYQSKVSEV